MRTGAENNRRNFKKAVALASGIGTIGVLGVVAYLGYRQYRKAIDRPIVFNPSPALRAVQKVKDLYQGQRRRHDGILLMKNEFGVVKINPLAVSQAAQKLLSVIPKVDIAKVTTLDDLLNLKLICSLAVQPSVNKDDILLTARAKLNKLLYDALGLSVEQVGVQISLVMHSQQINGRCDEEIYES